MKTYTITVALVNYKNKYLIGKRSSSKKFASNSWEVISGFLEEKKSAEEIILKELKEEVKLSGKIIRTTDHYSGNVKDKRWIVIPFLIEVNSDKFIINTEDHSELKWATSRELDTYPDLKDEIYHFKKLGLLQ